MTPRTERELRDLVAEQGWSSIRAAGSRGAWDLVLFRSAASTEKRFKDSYCYAVPVQEKSLKGSESPVLRWSDTADLKNEWFNLIVELERGVDGLVALRWRAPSHVKVPGGRWRFERVSRIPLGPKGFGILPFDQGRSLEDALGTPPPGRFCVHCGVRTAHTAHELHACGRCSTCGKAPHEPRRRARHVEPSLSEMHDMGLGHLAAPGPEPGVGRGF